MSTDCTGGQRDTNMFSLISHPAQFSVIKLFTKKNSTCEGAFTRRETQLYGTMTFFKQIKLHLE